MDTPINKTTQKSIWPVTVAGGLRAAFGLVWAIDAFFKWQPAFFNNYLSYTTDIVSGQPQWLLPWFNAWVSIIQINPAFFALMTCLIESAIALGLLFGLGRKWIYILGALFATLIWSIPEGFGGPYTPGATDVGGGLIYVFMFGTLILLDFVLGLSPYSVDFYIGKRFPAWRKLVEWAPERVLAEEPGYLPWRIQIVAIGSMVIILAVVLTILISELNAAPAASYIPAILHLAFLPHIMF